EKQYAFAGIVEAADRIYAGADAVKQVHHGGSAFGVIDRGHISLWLVHQQVDVTLGTVEEFAVDADVIAFGIGFAAEFADDLSVNRDEAAGDELFSFAPRGDSSGGDDFLQAFCGHSCSNRSRDAFIRFL